MTEYPPLVVSLSSAPIVLVGTVLEAPTLVGGPRPSRFDGSPFQLCRTALNVENLLKGSLSPGPATIYFYSYAGNIGGSAEPLANMTVGERDVFFLIKDLDTLRMACDGWKTCVPPVRTGLHLHFVAKPYSSLEDGIAEIMLTRGEGATDVQMIEAIEDGHTTFTNNGPLLKQLGRLSQSETPRVKSVAQDVARQLDEPCTSPSNDVPRK